MYFSTNTLFALLPLTTVALPSNSARANQTPQCVDGGTLHCCQASFTGSALPVDLIADLLCYDLTPAVDNCIITEAPQDPDTGCVGQPLCCQVNTLSPVLGLFCSKAPGDCTGKEGGDPAHCLDVIDDRFGNCTEADVDRQRGSLGLGPIGDVLEAVTDSAVGNIVKGITGPVGSAVEGALKPASGVVLGGEGLLANKGSD